MSAVLSITDNKKAGIQAVFLFCLVSFLWAMMETVIQFLPGEYDLRQLVWVRYATHVLFMLVLLGPHYRMRLVRTKRLPLQIGRSLLMLVMPISFILAGEQMATINAAAIFWVFPFMILGLSGVLLSERAHPVMWMFVLIGFLAVLALFQPNASVTLSGVVLALASGGSFGLYLVLTRMLRTEERVTNLFYSAAGVLVALSFSLPSFWRPLTLAPATLMAVIGVLGFCLLWAVDKAVETTRVTILAPVLFAQPFCMVILSLIVRNVLS